VSSVPATLDISSLQLLHHFSTSTGSTLAGNPGTSRVDRFWRVTAPKVGFSHYFLLDIILSVSAVHLATLYPDQRSSYLDQAEERLSRGVAQMGKELAGLCPENCDACWIASILVCHHTLGLGPQPQNYLCFGGDDATKWIYLLRGCRSIFETMSEYIGRGLLAELFSAEADNGCDGHEAPPQPIDYTTPLELLRCLLERADHDDCASPIADNLEALSLLKQGFEAAYGSGEERLRNNNGIVFVWLWRVPDGFIKSMLDKRPSALAIYAHFAVLLRTLEDHWFVKGWPRHIVQGIDAVTPPGYQACLEWPKDMLGWEEGRD